LQWSSSWVYTLQSAIGLSPAMRCPEVQAVPGDQSRKSYLSPIILALGQVDGVLGGAGGDGGANPHGALVVRSAVHCGANLLSLKKVFTGLQAHRT
jgi:hypothetical protein